MKHFLNYIFRNSWHLTKGDVDAQWFGFSRRGKDKSAKAKALKAISVSDDEVSNRIYSKMKPLEVIRPKVKHLEVKDPRTNTVDKQWIYKPN